MVERMRRREVMRVLGVAITAWPLQSLAQPAEKVWQVGFLGATSYSAYAERVEALREGLRRLGYTEGTNITIHFRWAEGQYERLPTLASELVHLKVDLILTHGTPGTRAAMAATSTIPIVAIVVGDLLSPGLVPSLARPGGNLTGQTFFFAEICAKRLELIKEAVPRAVSVAALTHPENASHTLALAAMQLTAQAKGINLIPLAVKSRNEIYSAFDTMRANAIDAFVAIDDAFLLSDIKLIADLALNHRIPAVFEKNFAFAKGFMSYGVDLEQLALEAATLVDQVLRGAKPADLPIRQATRFELIINLNTARAIGLEVPTALLLRADKVIE